MGEEIKKLKILKDLYDEYGDHFRTSMIWKDLHEAAREWVEYMEESLDPIKHYNTYTERIEKEAQIEWIRLFFNLV